MIDFFKQNRSFLKDHSGDLAFSLTYFSGGYVCLFFARKINPTLLYLSGSVLCFLGCLLFFFALADVDDFIREKIPQRPQADIVRFLWGLTLVGLVFSLLLSAIKFQ